MAVNPNETAYQQKPTAVNPNTQTYQQKPTAAEPVAVQAAWADAQQNQTPPAQTAAPQQNTNANATTQAGAKAAGSMIRGFADNMAKNPQVVSAQTQANAQTTQEATGGIYRVGDNGQAPKGLKVGDQVVTGGGTYTIKSVNPDGTYQSQLTNAQQTTGNYTGKYANAPVAPNNVYRVGADGKAPTGLKVGDQVVTAGGTYQITGINADGTYQSQLVNRDQTTANYTGAYANGQGTAPAAQTKQPEVPSFAKGYNPNLNYTTEIENARARGDLVAAAYYEQQRNAKIDAEGLGDKYAKTNLYSQYLSQLTPERQAQLSGGYVRESLMPQNPGDKINDLLTEWRAAAEAQAQGQIDYATQQGINELTRAMEDAQPQFQQQLDQLDIDTARAMSNSALYAEARGDRGGIGQSQYNEVQAAALKNKQAIDTARTKLATDTARQIADLRAQGEFQKADQLLTLSQQYLAKAMELAQWNANWALSQEEMARELEQWEANHAVQVANITGIYNGQPTRAAKADERDRVASVGEALLKAGVMPSDEQLAAIGMTKDQAQAYIWALSMGFSSGGSSSGGGSSGYSGSSSGGSGSGTQVPTPTTEPVKAPNAALTYTQPKNAAPTPWQKPIASGTQ